MWREIVIIRRRNRGRGGRAYAASLFRRLARTGSAIPVGEPPAFKPEEMIMFQVSPLPAQTFAHLFGLPDDELDSRGVVARQAGQGDRFPCRVSLRDARPGERALLLNYEHQSADTPYRSRYAIFVIEGAEEARLAPGELPQVFQRRPIALRAFSEAGMLLEAAMGMGEEIAPAIASLFANPAVSYLHAHNAMRGCYAARIDRA